MNKVIVSPIGQTRQETKGFSGSECQQASKFLEKTLGEPIAERLTSEFHKSQESLQKNQQQA